MRDAWPAPSCLSCCYRHTRIPSVAETNSHSLTLSVFSAIPLYFLYIFHSQRIALIHAGNLTGVVNICAKVILSVAMYGCGTR